MISKLTGDWFQRLEILIGVDIPGLKDSQHKTQRHQNQIRLRVWGFDHTRRHSHTITNEIQWHIQLGGAQISADTRHHKYKRTSRWRILNMVSRIQTVNFPQVRTFLLLELDAPSSHHHSAPSSNHNESKTKINRYLHIYVCNLGKKSCAVFGINKKVPSRTITKQNQPPTIYNRSNLSIATES